MVPNMVASPRPPTSIQIAERAYLGSLKRRDRRLTRLLERGTEPAVVGLLVALLGVRRFPFIVPAAADLWVEETALGAVGFFPEGSNLLLALGCLDDGCAGFVERSGLSFSRLADALLIVFVARLVLLGSPGSW